MKKQLIVLAILGLGCTSSQASQGLADANAELRSAVSELSQTLSQFTPNQETLQKPGATVGAMMFEPYGKIVGNVQQAYINGLDGGTYRINPLSGVSSMGGSFEEVIRQSTLPLGTILQTAQGIRIKGESNMWYLGTLAYAP